MKHFKDENNKLYGFESDAAQDLIDGYAKEWGVTLTALSDDEYQAATQPTDDEVAAQIRTKRDELLASSDWRVVRAKEQDASLSDDWKTYREALRKLPEQSGFPTDITWPTQPTQ